MYINCILFSMCHYFISRYCTFYPTCKLCKLLYVCMDDNFHLLFVILKNLFACPYTIHNKTDVWIVFRTKTGSEKVSIVLSQISSRPVSVALRWWSANLVVYGDFFPYNRILDLLLLTLRLRNKWFSHFDIA